MSSEPLKALKIEHLRGSVTPFAVAFDSHKKLTVVYGENGTGKSTICDAFEFLGKGTVGSLDNRGLGKTGSYWPSIGKSSADIAVTLECIGQSCRATVGGSEVVATPLAARPRVEVLRRAQIAALIQATAAERYKAVGRFVDVSGIEASEAALTQAIKSARSESEVAITRVQENEDAIRQFWEVAGRPQPDPFEWAETTSKLAVENTDSVASALARLDTAFRQIATYPKRVTDAEETLQVAVAAKEVAAGRVTVAASQAADDAEQTVLVLSAARGYFRAHPSPAHCPLCESNERIAGLAERIDERLGALSSLRAVKSNEQNADSSVQLAGRGIQDVKESYARDAAQFKAILGELTWPANVRPPATELPSDVSLLQSWLAANQHLTSTWIDWIAARKDHKQFVETLTKAVATRTANRQAQELLGELLPKLERTLEVVATERKAFTDDVLAKIATKVGVLYEKVHPGEGLDKISLALDPKRRASLEIQASFCGARTAPQAYFSDSHLDTLSLCVFLALAGLDLPSETVLVLDDVLASVDEPHVDRLIEMLYEEALTFRHCLITTHYRPWKQKFRWGWLRHGQCHFVELGPWTSAAGMTTSWSVPEAESLRVLLSATPPDAQAVCAKAGVILEAVLDFITQTYECEVPRRAGGRYTLGDLLPAIDKKLKKALRVEIRDPDDTTDPPSYTSVPLGALLDELDRIAQARNVFGCHFSAISFELLESDAIAFAQQVLELVDAISDPASGWPRSDKSGSYWATAGDTRRLHPLKRPR